MGKELIILLVIIGVAALVAIIAYIVHRYLRPRLKEDKPTEEEVLQEEMDRILKPVDDEEAAKEIEEYKEEDE